MFPAALLLVALDGLMRPAAEPPAALPAEPPAPPPVEPPAKKLTEPPAAPPVETGRARVSSLSVVNSLAKGRIHAFQSAVDDAKKSRAAVDAFKVKPVTGPLVNSEAMHRETLKNKVSAFETASKYKGKVELKKTWRQADGAGNYSAGQRIVMDNKTAKPPSKKRITDLP